MDLKTKACIPSARENASCERTRESAHAHLAAGPAVYGPTFTASPP